MKQSEKDKTREFLIDWIICWKPCFDNVEVSEKWIEMFCNKRLETFLAVDKDMIEEKIGIDLDNQKNLNEFKKIYKEMFIDEIHDHINQLKKIKDEEEREQYKKKCVVRKPQTDEKSRKKRKK